MNPIQERREDHAMFNFGIQTADALMHSKGQTLYLLTMANGDAMTYLMTD
jgi:hypothetical protein